MKTPDRKTSSKFRLCRVASTVGLIVVTLGGPLIGAAAAANEGGWYTKAQAKHGQLLFNDNCAQCHRPDLTGAMGPALIGPKFLKKWENKPVDDLYNFAHSKMPAINPGSIPAGEMWTIVAYILEKNGFPSGSAPLDQKTAGNRVLAKK
jgi:mono/diheme cytochrome c family protein